MLVNVSSALTHSNLVLELVQKTCEKGKGTLLLTEISWFWRTGYNAAIDGCSTWESCENDIADLFGLVEQASNHEFQHRLAGHQ